jgi:two-component system response regulator AtoC
MIELLEAMENVAGFKTPALLMGERGTHREVLARAIHAQSARRAAPFVAVRCRDADPDTLERHVFGEAITRDVRGHALGAQGGTLFLDDVEALSAGAQRRLLHLIHCGEVERVGGEKAIAADVRVIAAATRGPDAAAHEGGLSHELAEALAPAVLAVPSLRERAADVPLLVDHLVARYAADLGVDVDCVSDTAMDRLVAYAWPGNLRELENVIERAMLLAQTDRITLDELPNRITEALAEGAGGSGADHSLRRARRSCEADMIRRALRRTDGNRTRAAKLLEISHRALLYKIKEYGIRD